MLEVSLVIRYEAEDHRLEASESVYFDAAQPHGYRRLPKKAHPGVDRDGAATDAVETVFS